MVGVSTLFGTGFGFKQMVKQTIGSGQNQWQDSTRLFAIERHNNLHNQRNVSVWSHIRSVTRSSGKRGKKHKRKTQRAPEKSMGYLATRSSLFSLIFARFLLRIRRVGAYFFVIFLEGGKIFSRLGELALKCQKLIPVRPEQGKDIPPPYPHQHTNGQTHA